MSAQQLPGGPDAAVHLPVLAFTLVLAVVTGIVFGRRAGADRDPGQHLVDAEGRQHARLGQPRYQFHPFRPCRGRDCARAGAPRRRRSSDPQLRAAAAGRSGLLVRERADGADRAAPQPLPGPGEDGCVLGPADGEGARAAGRHRRRVDVQRAVQRHGELGLVQHRRLHAAARPAQPARPAGDRRRRLLRAPCTFRCCRVASSTMATP